MNTDRFSTYLGLFAAIGQALATFGHVQHSDPLAYIGGVMAAAGLGALGYVANKPSTPGS